MLNDRDKQKYKHNDNDNEVIRKDMVSYFLVKTFTVLSIENLNHHNHSDLTIKRDTGQYLHCSQAALMGRAF